MKTVAVFPLTLIFACALASAQTNGARTVKYAQSDIVEVHAKLRFSTVIVLPADEDILDFTTGDKDYWIINGSHNLCYLHPAAAASFPPGIADDLHRFGISPFIFINILERRA